MITILIVILAVTILQLLPLGVGRLDVDGEVKYVCDLRYLNTSPQGRTCRSPCRGVINAQLEDRDRIKVYM